MRTFFYIVICIILLAGIVFKIQHWPGAGTLMIISLSSIAFGMLVFSYEIGKSLFALLPLLFAFIVIGALFKILHWPYPHVITEVSNILFSIAVPVMFFKRGFELRAGNAKLSQHFFMIAVGFAAFAIIVQVAPFLYRESINLFILIAFIVVMGLVIILLKTLRIEGFKAQFIPEQKTLKFLLVICLISVFVFPW